jgi:hypothetical protein
MRDDLRRLIKGWLLAAATGAAILSLLKYGLLPEVARRITPAQTAWLRDAFRTHPFLCLCPIFVAALILGLPVLWVALRAVQPQSVRK